MKDTRLVNDFFTFMPKTTTLKESDKDKQLNLIKDSKEKISNINPHHDFCEHIIELIYERLTTNNDKYLLSIADYKRIKTLLSRIKVNQLQFLKDSIILFLKTSNEELIKELVNFSNEVDWYPEEIKIKEADNYVYKKLPIEITDSLLINSRLISIMQRTINQMAHNLLEKDEDYNEICKYIKESRDNREFNDELLKNFDEEYSFLEKFPLFKDTYINARNNYYNILLEDLRIIYNKQNERKMKELYGRNHLATLERRKERKAIYDKKRRETNY